MSSIIVNGQSVDAAITASTGVTARVNSGSTTPRRPRVNFIEGTDISISVLDDAGDGEVEVTISSLGSSFPGFSVTTPAADAGAGSPGSSGVASHGDHVHPISAVYRPVAYRMRSNGAAISGVGTLSLAPFDGIAYTPRLVIGIGTVGATASVIGAAVSTSVEGCFEANVGVNNDHNDFIDTTLTGGADTWNITTFSSTNVTASHTVGTALYNGVWFITGDA
jgi:hypothetical protein